MDALFEAQFSPLADSGRALSKCGKCLRYMKYISTQPSRLYCGTCEEVYYLPQKGTIKVIEFIYINLYWNTLFMLHSEVLNYFCILSSMAFPPLAVTAFINFVQFMNYFVERTWPVLCHCNCRMLSSAYFILPYIGRHEVGSWKISLVIVQTRILTYSKFSF